MLAPRAAAPRPSPGGLLPRRWLFASRMMKRKSDPPKKARAGLIKSFELKRRKQSEETAGPSRSKSPSKKSRRRDRGRRRRAREHSRASPSLFAGVRQLPWPHTRSLRSGACLTCEPARLPKRVSSARCAIAARAGPKPQAIKTRSDPQGPPYGGTAITR